MSQFNTQAHTCDVITPFAHLILTEYPKCFNYQKMS